MKQKLLFFIIISIFLSIRCSRVAGDNSSALLVSSNSYSGHESDADANNLVRAYPSVHGTRLDNCQTCHKGANIVYTSGKSKTVYNACTYCHIRVFQKSEDYSSGYPASYKDTLNTFGLAYLKAGRSINALKSIAELDSDGDGFSNKNELNDLRYPGNASSKPDQPLAHTITLSFNELKAMPYHSQFFLMNATKQQFDEYLTYGGIKIKDFFEGAGVSLDNAEGFSVFAPDGYQIEFNFSDFDYLSASGGFPDGKFYSVDQSGWDLDKQFIKYPDKIPDGVSDGGTLSNLYMMLAYEKNSLAMESSYYDSTDGRINGEGPFRIIRPQISNANNSGSHPFGPDRGAKSLQYSDGWDYQGDAYDHNAGYAVKGSCVIRIDPMPEGYEEYDWTNGWKLIQDKKIVIYGHGIE